jgi:hypothetical protein
MSISSRVHYYSICGAVGGLVGWFLAALFFRDSNLLIHQLSRGTLLAAPIGLSLLAYDSRSNRAPTRSARAVVLHLFSGAAVGGAALPLSHWLNERASAVFVPVSLWESAGIGLVCWLLFGGLTGLGVAVARGFAYFNSFRGGVAGGLLGALIDGVARAAYSQPATAFEQQVFLAIALSALGGTIGFSVASGKQLLHRAWVEIVSGKFTGRHYDLTKFMAYQVNHRRLGTIGSDEWSSQIYLPDDEVMPRHALIGSINGTPTLLVSPEAGESAHIFINGREVIKSALKDGDRLQIGSTTLLYRHRRK